MTMKANPGNTEGRPLFRTLRDLYLNRRSGVLRLEGAGDARTLYFVAGELHLPTAHPLSEALRTLLAQLHVMQENGAETGVSRAEILTLQKKLVSSTTLDLQDFVDAELRFDEDLRSIPSDLIGPFPTAHLVMEFSVHGSDSSQLQQRMESLESNVVACPDQRRMSEIFGIDPGEMFVLTRAEKPIDIQELVSQVSGDRKTVLRMICRLMAIDLLQVDLAGAASSSTTGDRLLDAMVARFIERIEARLESDPITLDAAEHRSRLAKLLAQVGSLSHYELLGVGFHDGVDRVHEAYDRLAREVHPSHVERLGLVGKEAAIRLLFERATLAYLTLTDPERRTAYNRDAGIEASGSQSPDERSAERRAVARNNYERALELAEHEDYHFALELARIAARADPQPPYLALLGRIQARNPLWLDQATESFRRAIQLDPDEPSFRVELARLLEGTGDLARARVHYRAVLQRDPANDEAMQGLDRLGVSGSLPLQGGAGLLERIKRRFLD